NTEVVVEASTLALITLLPDTYPVLLSAFSAIRLARPSLVDVDEAFGDLRRDPSSFLSVGYDPEHGVLVSRQVSLPEHQRLYRRIRAVDHVAPQPAISAVATRPDPTDAPQAWLAAVDLAAERRLALWSDDVAIRSIAATKQVP